MNLKEIVIRQWQHDHVAISVMRCSFGMFLPSSLLDSVVDETRFPPAEIKISKDVTAFGTQTFQVVTTSIP